MSSIALMTRKLEQARWTLQRLEDLSRDYNGSKRDILDLGLDLARIRVSAMDRILTLIKQNGF